MNKLLKLIYCIFQPGCIRGIGMHANQSDAALWHKKLSQKNHPNLPRYQWHILFFCSRFIWYALLFWIHFLLTLVLSRAASTKKVTLSQLISDLLYLGLWIGAAPSNYFHLKLSSSPKHLWFEFIFTEEQLTWYVKDNAEETLHSVLKEELGSLADKYSFEKQLAQHAIPHIKSIYYISKATSQADISSAIDAQISSGKDFFIKPQSANAMRGCVTVKVDKTNITCSASGFNLQKQSVELSNKSQLMTFINNIITANANSDRSGVLFQPLLTNNDELQKITHSKNLSVIRIITCINQSTIDHPLTFKQNLKVIFSFIETQTSTEQTVKQWQGHAIDSKNGELQGYRLTQWNHLLDITTKAHQLYPSITSIAWDIAISDKGVVIIEGNSGWDVIEPQSICNKRALSTELLYQ